MSRETAEVREERSEIPSLIESVNYTALATDTQPRISERFEKLVRGSIISTLFDSTNESPGVG